MDPRQVIDERPMSALQIAAVAVTIGLNALDGFDVLSISFAAPGIAREWGIERAALGVVLSMELIGMAVGSIFLGGVADRIGRRPMILGCLIVMAVGMAGATFSRNVTELSAWRVLTGIGIGGMIPSLNALAAEYSNARWRRLSLSLMVIGYPIGVVIGGSIAAILLKGGDWRTVFQFGAAVTLGFLPLALFFIPESPGYLAARRPPRALARLNRILTRMKHPAIADLPPAEEKKGAFPLAALFSPGLLATTLLVTFGYFAHIVVFYYVAKWTPTIVVEDMHGTASDGASVLRWLSVGGVLGGALFGLVAQRVSLKALTAIVLVLTAGMLFVYGRGEADLARFSLIAAITGVFIQGGVVALYTIFAEAFPTHVRAAGTGFAIGAGRGGALLAPMLAGFLFQAGFGLQTVSVLMGLGSLLAAVAVVFIRLNAAGRAPAVTSAAARAGS